MSRFEEKAQRCWGDELPDWVLVLAKEADATSQNKLAKRIGRTSGLISQVIGNTYGARLDAIEEVVRGVLMSAKVNCPGAGEAITTDKCQEWRKKSKEYRGNNSQRVRMFKACRSCPLNKSIEERTHAEP